MVLGFFTVFVNIYMYLYKDQGTWTIVEVLSPRMPSIRPVTFADCPYMYTLLYRRAATDANKSDLRLFKGSTTAWILSSRRRGTQQPAIQ